MDTWKYLQRATIQTYHEAFGITLETFDWKTWILFT